MNWPQWVVLGTLLFSLGVTAALHGRERSPYDFGSALFSAVLIWWLLWMGGFWG